MNAQRTTTNEVSSNDSMPRIRVLDLAPRYLKHNDTIWKYSGICKTLRIEKLSGQDYESLTAKKHDPLIQIHGNITYDFLYRSFADTPYYQKDFQQHTLQSSMDITVKDKYAFHFNILLRTSNSPWFRNFFDPGIQFDRNIFLANMKRHLENKLNDLQLQKPDLQLIEAAIKNNYTRISEINRFLAKPDLAQLIIEERERIYYRQIKTDKPNPTLNASLDSATNNIQDYLSKQKKELDSLQKLVAGLQGKADSLKHDLFINTTAIRQKIYQARNITELKKINTEYGIPMDRSDKLEKIASSVRSFGIGRTVLNYSELTANNVSLTGLNVEYNPRQYFAFAIGKIDYGFRDFFGRSNSPIKQNLLLGRLGYGDKDRRAIIFSVFTGKKYNYGTVLNDTVNGYVNVLGYSVEAIWKKNENVNLNIELAKSTRPVSGSLSDTKETSQLFKFSDQSNQAISIKAQTIIPETHTRLNGFFRKTGEHFQSFSLFTYNTDQTAWLLKADQSFYKEKINIVATLRRNDFTNPFTEKTFKTTTVFTSIQANIRMPHLPVISFGYYPGTQLYIVNREHIRENVYYILNGSLVHTYSMLGAKMVTSVIYNRYSNKGTDSGFINYSGSTYLISHAVLYRKLQLNANYIFTDQQELKYFTLETNASYTPSSVFHIGGGGKFNRTSTGKTYWGGSAQLFVTIKKLGSLQLQYEKSFLPTIYQSLFPVDIGRVTWFKYF